MKPPRRKKIPVPTGYNPFPIVPKKKSTREGINQI